MEFEIEEDKPRKGNPIASMRYRWQTYTKDTDLPCESEWEQLKQDAIYQGAKCLVKQNTKFGTDDLVVKVFNCMNHKEKPVVITLEFAKQILNNFRK